MQPVVFASLWAPFFARYMAEITNNIYCPLGTPENHDSYSGIYDMSSPDRNLFMVGLYRPDRKSTKNFYKRSRFLRHVVLFAGGDLMDLYAMSNSTRDQLFRYLVRRRTIFAVESPQLQQYIQSRFGFDTEVVYLPARHNYPAPAPIPAQFTVGCYMPYYRRPFYGWPVIIQAIKMMPDVRFHFYSVLGYQPLPEEEALQNLTCHPHAIDDMPNFVAQMSCGIRITTHDTYAMSAIEYNLGGRWFLNNHLMPFCEKLSSQPSASEIVGLLRIVQSRTHPNMAGHEHYQKYHTAKTFITTLERLYS